jgi:hypothetical protein
VPACLPACLSACLRVCLPACLPACLHTGSMWPNGSSFSFYTKRHALCTAYSRMAGGCMSQPLT